MEKWVLAIYGLDGPRYAEGNLRFRGKFQTRRSAEGGARLRRERFPGTVAEITRYILRPGGWWSSNGVRDVDVFEVWNDGEGGEG